jgi:hypothetical protein
MSDILAQSFGNVMVPDGTYDGVITGQTVKFNRDATGYSFETIRPTKEENQKVKIIVKFMKANVYRVD